MRRIRRGLSALLSVLMLTALLPTSVLATEVAAAEEVAYNLQSQVITVGSDPQRTELDGTYALFESDGSYTIELEEDAFFPYEVQFTYGGNTWSEWFMEPEDTVTVGGHRFAVHSQAAEEGKLIRLGLEIGDTYVPVYPEAKTFTDGGQVAPQSLLPLKEVSLNDVDLTGFLPAELKQVKVSAVLSSDQLNDAQAVVWAKGYRNDDFIVIGSNGTMDLSLEEDWDNWEYLQLIVGTADQLDPNNIRYNIGIRVTPYQDMLTFQAANENRTAITVFGSYRTDGRQNGKLWYTGQIGVDKTQWQDGQKAYLAMYLNTALVNKEYPITAKVYEGYYETKEAIPADAEDIAATAWNVDPTAEGKGVLDDYGWRSGGYENMHSFTLVLQRGDAVEVVPFVAYMYEAGIDVYATSVCADNGSNSRTNIWYTGQSRWDKNLQMYVLSITLDPGYKADAEYYLSLRLNNPDPDATDSNGYGLDSVEHAAEGNYATVEELKAQDNIKDQLFSNGYQNGYLVNLSETKVFTVLDTKGDLHHEAVRVVENTASAELPAEPKPDSADTYFQMNGAQVTKTEVGSETTSTKSLPAYIMRYQDDGYYYNGYQTVFLMNREYNSETSKYVWSPVADGTEIMPTFYTGNGVRMFAGATTEDGQVQGGTLQESGETAIKFKSGDSILYSAAAEDGKNLKNYRVTFLTQQTGGPQLFVNAANDATRQEDGMPVREVYLDQEHDNHHDIFFANIGDEAMDNIYVKLEAENVALDEYWTVKEDSVKSLAAFTTTEKTDTDGNWVSYGQLANVAKIRLVPAVDEETGLAKTGVISGTLTIGYGDPEDPTEVTIKLTGLAGDVKIITDQVVNGVKYVPYSCVIQTNSMYASNAVTFALTGGSLPSGFVLKPNGEIYGVPQTTGKYTFTVTATYQSGDYKRSDSREYTLVIEDNTDDNVWNSTDTDYELGPDAAGTFTGVITGQREDDGNGNMVYKDQVFHSAGPLVQFVQVFLDGRQMTEGSDYLLEDGSTKITVRAQTFQNLSNGKHTIAAEFRTGGKTALDSPMKKAAQNFTITGNYTPSTNPGTTTKPEEPKTAADIFDDISVNDWFFADVDWAYQNKLMIGVTATKYYPKDLISHATVVTVLARMDGADLSKVTANPYPEILSDQWYTPAAVWAKDTGLLPEGVFSAQPPIARGDFALILYKYLKHLNVNCDAPETPVAFTDADDMSQEMNDAFQVLYQYGIFKGIGNYTMDAQGATTRAQLAVLLHRLSVFVESQK